MQPIVVPSLRIEATGGPTCYAGEGGFSAVSCELTADSPELAGELNAFIVSGKPVTVRCGLLETTGTLELLAARGGGQSYSLRIQSVRFGVLGDVI